MMEDRRKEDRRTIGSDEVGLLKTVLTSFLKMRGVYSGDEMFLIDDDKSLDDSTALVVVLTGKILDLKENNHEIWSDLIDLIKLLGHRYLLEDGGTHLRIIKS